jgi:hypothetical protein
VDERLSAGGTLTATSVMKRRTSVDLRDLAGYAPFVTTIEAGAAFVAPPGPTPESEVSDATEG